MKLNVRLRPVTAALMVATAAALAAAVAPTAATPRYGTTGHAAAGHSAAVTTSQQLAVLRYWTRSRMEHAAPADLVPRQEFFAAPARNAAVAPARPATPGSMGSLWQGGGAVARAAGKIFYTLNGTNYVCSGSTVASANADVVVTAAHCVCDGSGNWATNWTFVPGYVNGNKPYGSYPARRFFVPSQWSSGAGEDYDVAFVALRTAKVGGVQTHAVTTAGGLSIAFGSRPTRAYAFGYPSEPPYNGQRLDYCDGTTSLDPYNATSDTGLHCAITGGSSGGPWLSGFRSGTGTITSVTSFKYNNGSEVIYGPTLGSTARSLYEQAEHA
ncbi:MAG TPA: trypsin-like peptidase domain-containing protein [Streptosporangiaceae bacterium]|jgi:V8-like Glu-specific endopeptidase|nr:trypsin-like peptidase domain-containing protein [Streptosporangiaceae bacterium]